MTKDEALDLALEALENFADVIKYDNEQDDIGCRACCYVLSYDQHSENCKATKAITAIKQARALDKMADNARELGLDYEPVGLIDRLTNPEQHYAFTSPKKANAVLMSLCQEAADALAAQPAPVQEPIAWTVTGNVTNWSKDFSAYKTKHYTRPVYTTPPAAQPAPVQEPVNQRAHEMALRQWESWKQYALELQEKLVKYEGGAPMVLNTTPPAAQRQWVGLTDEEKQEWIDAMSHDPQPRHFMSLINSIETDLKERNV
jgi:hypothetical protein